MRDKAWRMHKRNAKANRRIKLDRNQHWPSGTLKLEDVCACFGSDDKALWGKTFSKFADYPQACSCWLCGNVRRQKHFKTKDKLTRQEQLAMLTEREFRRQIS